MKTASRLSNVREPVINKLVTLILKSDMTYDEIARQSGVTSQTLYNWVSGRVISPQLAKAARVARVLGHDFDLIRRGK